MGVCDQYAHKHMLLMVYDMANIYKLLLGALQGDIPVWVLNITDGGNKFKSNCGHTN